MSCPPFWYCNCGFQLVRVLFVSDMVSTPGSYKSIFCHESCWLGTDRQTDAHVNTLWGVVFGDKTEYFVGTDIYLPCLMSTAWSPEHVFLVSLTPFSLEHLSTPVSIKWSFPSVSPFKTLLALLSSQLRATFSAHLILFYLKSRIMFSYQYKS